MKQSTITSTQRHAPRAILLIILLAAFLMPSAVLAQSSSNAAGPTIFVPLVTGQVAEQSVRAAAAGDLFFSEYIEGSSFNKAVEIYNGTGATVDLSTYQLELYSNGSATPSQSVDLAGTIAAGGVYVVAHGSADTAILAVANATSNAVINFNGDDAVVLRKNGAVVDAIGQVGVDPGSQWGTGDASTQDNTIRRKSTICQGDTNETDPFDPSIEWDGFAQDTFDGLGTHASSCDGDIAPAVSATTPANNATDVAADSDIAVTFSEPVTVVDPWFTISCTNSGTHTAAVTGGPTTFTLNPDNDFTVGDNCTVTISAANVSDIDVDDPPDTPTADYSFSFSVPSLDPCSDTFTPIYAIQGSGVAAAITGPVTTQGVVVGDYEGASPTLRGFFMQDAIGDGDATTSDGIFVFNGNNDSVNLGDIVRVTGSAGEFQGQTQISSTAIVSCGSDSTMAPVDVTLPFASADEAERYEGMLVRLPQTLYVTEHFQLGRFGQVVMSSDSRLYQPTNQVAPGAAAIALQTANNLNRIIIDDNLNNQNPDPILFGRDGQPLSASNTLRGGDTATGIVGVMTYTWAGNSASGNAYRVRPIGALNGAVEFVGANPRPQAAPARTGSLRVAGMNLLNFFNTFDGLPDTVDNCTGGVSGAAMDCRGADTQEEFDRQWPKTIAAMVGTDADIIGVIELENDGYGPESAIQFLVNKLNEATAAGTYAFIDVDAATSQIDALGDDAIKVGLIYKPAKVTPVGQTAALNTVDFVNGGDDAPRNRPALAQAFEEVGTGGTFVVSVNHLKSKGSACTAPDANDGQGNCNIVRLNAANLLTAWLASDPTGVGDPDALIIGDLNSYAMEDPITAIKNAGYTNLINSFGGAEAYSYVFDGQWGYLDHALSTGTLTPQVTNVTDWHINADEPNVLDYNTDFKSTSQVVSLYSPDEFRISDHDPVLVDLDLDATPPIGHCNGYTVYTSGTGYVAFPEWNGTIRVGNNRNNTIFGTDGPDLMLGLGRNDLLIGNGGDDVICGGDGVDLLLGLDGNDFLDGG
ncbi:MAG: ExeM/NucH family extracellular endonuclease, partial [Caldilineaceae bacterium]|nr:ExeM/NucH family extracellular endonuclease [Caldilineaceae bacterium]